MVIQRFFGRPNIIFNLALQRNEQAIFIKIKLWSTSLLFSMQYDIHFNNLILLNIVWIWIHHVRILLERLLRDLFYNLCQETNRFLAKPSSLRLIYILVCFLNQLSGT